MLVEDSLPSVSVLDTEPCLTSATTKRLLVISKQQSVNIAPQIVRSVGVQCNMRQKTRSVRVQTVAVATCSVEVQCSRRPAISSTGLVDACAEADNDEDYYMDNEDTDPSYNPSSDSDNDDEQSASNAANRKSPVTSISSECMTESKYIVYEAMLMSLFTVCLMCKNATQGVVKFIVVAWWP
jgi:hypothetical protein